MPNLKSQSGIIPLVVLAIVGAVSASGVTALASQKSIPGDALYPVKGITENVRVAAAFSKINKAKVHLDIAEEKVKEIEKLEEKGKTDEQSSLTDKIAEAAQTLEESQEQALELTESVKSEGGDVDELVELLEVQSNRQQVVIKRVLPRINVQVGESLRKSLEEFREELKVTIESIEEDEEDENLSSATDPCPSPGSSEDENNYQEEEETGSEEDVDEDWDDYWERKYPEEEDYWDEDVEGVKIGFSQLRNSQNSSSGSSGGESSSEGGSQTFDGAETSGNSIEGGIDGSRDPCDGSEVGTPPSTDPGVEGVSTNGGLLQLILNALFPPQR